jgi:hypothetical protein
MGDIKMEINILLILFAFGLLTIAYFINGGR